MKLGIAGVGLIGASIGLRAAELGWEVAGWDVDPANLRLARERGAVADTRASLAELARWSGVLVLAAPLGAILAALGTLRERAPELDPALAIYDVASVKVPVAQAARGLPGFVGTHPIAGSERNGPAAARADLFAGRVWTYDAAAAPAAQARAREFIAAMGARPEPVDGAEHDRIVALTSHLPQLVSVALGSQLAPALARAGVAELCGTGMASMLRLARSSWPVWHAILAANALPVAQEVRRLTDILSVFAAALEAGTPESLEIPFGRAAAAAASLVPNVRDAGNVDVDPVESTATEER